MPARDQWKSPVSSAIMQEVEVEGITVHFDPQSGGYWFEKGELQSLAEHHHPYLQNMQVGSYLTTHQGRSCPQDNEALLEFEFDEHSGIKLDICPACRGIWLDGGELEGIISYLEQVDFTAEIPDHKHDDHVKLSSRLLLFLYKIAEYPPLF